MYGLYMDRENQEYGRYKDNLNNWYTQLDHLTKNYNTAYDRGYDNYQFGYNSARSEYDTDRSEEFSKWQMEQQNAKSEQKDAYNRISNLISASGYKPTDSELKAAGMTRAEADALLNGYNAPNAGEYEKLDYEQQKKWGKEFDNAVAAKDLNKIDRVADQMEQAGFDPQIVADWRDYYAELITGKPKPQPPKTGNGKVGGTGTGGGGGGAYVWDMK
jgi:hypothetical protein